MKKKTKKIRYRKRGNGFLLSLFFLLYGMITYSQDLLSGFTVNEGNYAIANVGNGDFMVEDGEIKDSGSALDVINFNGNIKVSRIVTKENAILFILSRIEAQLLGGFEVHPDGVAEIWVGGEFFQCTIGGGSSKNLDNALVDEGEGTLIAATEADTLSELVNLNSGMTIYPNPFNTLTHLGVDGEQASRKVRLEVYDLSGRLVDTQMVDRISGNSYQAIPYDGAHLEAGVYSVKLWLDSKVLTGKLIKR